MIYRNDDKNKMMTSLITELKDTVNRIHFISYELTYNWLISHENDRHFNN